MTASDISSVHNICVNVTALRRLELASVCVSIKQKHPEASGYQQVRITCECND
jgi:hypothetical protein